MTTTTTTATTTTARPSPHMGDVSTDLLTGGLVTNRFPHLFFGSNLYNTHRWTKSCRRKSKTSLVGTMTKKRVFKPLMLSPQGWPCLPPGPMKRRAQRCRLIKNSGDNDVMPNAQVQRPLQCLPSVPASHGGAWQEGEGLGGDRRSSMAGAKKPREEKVKTSLPSFEIGWFGAEVTCEANEEAKTQEEENQSQNTKEHQGSKKDWKDQKRNQRDEEEKV